MHDRFDQVDPLLEAVRPGGSYALVTLLVSSLRGASTGGILLVAHWVGRRSLDSLPLFDKANLAHGTSLL